jgi:hypothetical protein
LLKRGVTITIFSLTPEAYIEDGREHHAELLNQLAAAGIQVNQQNRCPERYAVIDQSLVWYGSTNLLSNDREDNSVMRIFSLAIAAELQERSVEERIAIPHIEAKT